jgi:hypothetical protein
VLGNAKISIFLAKRIENTEFSANQILSETIFFKVTANFQQKKFKSADFDRVGRVKGNKLIFNFGLSCYLLKVSRWKKQQSFHRNFDINSHS